jgi:predicted small integral membrane protein
MKLIKRKGIILTWGSGITRSSTLANVLDFQDIQLKFYLKPKILKPFNYILNFFVTLFTLIKLRPDSLVVVCPPTLTVFPALIYKAFLNHNCILYADMHNGVIRKEWKNIPFLKLCLKKFNFILCHNTIIKTSIDKVFNVKSVVLTDPLLKDESSSYSKQSCSKYLKEKKINVLVPVSYAADEPIDQIIESANILQQTHNFILTGNFHKVFSMDIQFPGVTFTGYISKSTYFQLMRTCEIVLCLTKDDTIQMCALIESMSLKKSVVCSDNKVNRTTFHDYGLEYTHPNSEGIVHSIKITSTKLGENIFQKEEFISLYEMKWMKKMTEIFR